jgi:hypothetical protein
VKAGYYASWTLYTRGYEVADIPAQRLTHINYAFANISAAGEVVLGDSWADVEMSYAGDTGADDGAASFFAACREHAVPCDLALGLFDARVFDRVFSSETARARLLRQIEALLASTRADGVHLDMEIFEPPSAEAVSGAQRFVQALSERLKQGPVPRRLSVFLVMGAEVDIYGPATLDLFDRVVLQGYDAHWPTGERAGPLAPLAGPDKLNWPNALKAALARGIARERILLSVPYYGYEWQTESERPRARAIGRARELTYALKDSERLPRIPHSALEKAALHGTRRDSESGSPYYTYRDPAGAAFQGWYEDAESLRAKYRFIQREGIGGAAVFPVRYDAGRLDPLLREFFVGAREEPP